MSGYHVCVGLLPCASILCFIGCCIYEKPKIFGESSDEDDDDHDCTDHCRGHKSKKDYRHDHDHSPDDQHPSQPDGYTAASKHSFSLVLWLHMRSYDI